MFSPDNAATTIEYPRSRPRRQTESVESFAAQHRLKTQISGDGTKIIGGRFGHVFEFDHYSLGALIMPNPPRKRYWGCIRAEMLKAGMTLVQDGDGEGAAIFDPDNPVQAKLAIRSAGIKRKRQLNLEQIEQRIAFLQSPSGRAHSGPGTHRKPRDVEKSKRRGSKTFRAASA